MNFVARTVEESRVDKYESLAHGVNRLLQIDGCPSLFIHETQFDCVCCKTKQAFDSRKQRICKRRFRRTVHLRLDDIDATEATVR